MKKKLALVFGSNGGIGIASVKQLLGDGMQVCAMYNKGKEKIEGLQHECSDEDILSVKCDVTDEASVNSSIEDILSRFGKIDVVMFSVSPALKYKPMLNLEWEDYSEFLDLQVKAMILVVKSLRQQIRLKVRMKFIVVLTECCVGTPPTGFSHYVTSKYAALGLSKTMARDLSQYNCTVNMITPGMIETELLANFPAKLVEMAAHENPMKRIGSPEDVARVVSFLASDQSDYLNGANITVNGGSVMF